MATPTKTYFSVFTTSPMSFPPTPTYTYQVSLASNQELMEEVLKRGLMNVIKGYKKSAE